MSQRYEIASKILENSVSAIELGIEDFKLSKKDPRRLHSAVRNLFAGILLLFKSKLAELSQNDNESLLKQKVIPVIQDGEIKWVGEGEKTVDVQQIQNRFKSLNIEIDWKRLNALKNYRNKIEHYFDKENVKSDVVGNYIADSFVIITDFLKKQLDIDPPDTFKSETWELFLQEQKVLAQERDDRDENFEQLTWISYKIKNAFKAFQCPECGCQIISTLNHDKRTAEDEVFVCRCCNEHFGYNEILDSVIEDFSRKEFLSIKDGGEEEIAYCPECGKEKYIVSEQTCFACGASGPFICEFCDNEVPPCELLIYAETGRCSWCEHQYDKMMDDD